MISVGRDVGKLKLLYIDVESADTLKNVFAVLQMGKHRVTMSPINFYPTEIKKIYSHKHIHECP